MKRKRKSSARRCSNLLDQKKNKKELSRANEKANENPSKAMSLRSLFSLPKSDLRWATLIRRPSKRNRSPYVADICVDSFGGKKTHEAIAHVPSLELGGKCVEGSRLLVQIARDRKGNAVPPSATGKYGTPKCTYITRLCLVKDDENKNRGSQYKNGTWVGAHPSIGEKIAEELFQLGNVYEPLDSSKITAVHKQVAKFAGTNSRLDYLVEMASGKAYAVEVKTVVDTDYDPGITQPVERKFHGRKYNRQGMDNDLYQRAAIFPWGNSNQKGPDGEKVVSTRAIAHVDNLMKVVTGELTHGQYGINLKAAILFIIVREDAAVFRPNTEACPSFAKHLKDAHDKGVKVIAHAVSWGHGDETTPGKDLGTAYCAGTRPIILG
mmetsp:Transcript_17659/g.21752  ORF Transcript_17659/g.21752 Transcript_17659/m.21752 type:complete len:380 (+) Transcript_17659:169-1308(+)